MAGATFLGLAEGGGPGLMESPQRWGSRSRHIFLSSAMSIDLPSIFGPGFAVSPIPRRPHSL